MINIFSKRYKKMISGTLTTIYKKIEEAGPNGVRKTELIKEFGKNSSKQLEELLSQGLIHSIKVRNSTIYLTKENYDNYNIIQESSKTKKENLLNELRDMISLQNNRIDSIFNMLEDRTKDIYDNINIINNKLNNNSIHDILNTIDSLKNNNTSLVTRLNTLEENLNKISKDYMINNESVKSKIDNLSSMLETLRNNINNIAVLESKVNDNSNRVSNEISIITRSLNDIQTRLLKHDKGINEIQNAYTSLKPLIEKKADIEMLTHIENNIKNITSNMNNELKEERVKIENISKLLSIIEQNIKRIEENLTKKTNNDSFIKIESTITELMNNLNDIKSSIDSLKNNNTSLVTRLNTLEENLNKISKDYMINNESVKSKIDNLSSMLETLRNNINNIAVLESKVNDNTKKIGILNNTLNALNEIKKDAEESNINTKLSNMESIIAKLSNDINNVKAELHNSISSIYMQLEDVKSNSKEEELSLEQFKMEFDRAIAESSNSIGWIELADIRKKILAKYKISKNTFYSLVSALLDISPELYEISSGGKEGVVIRGLVHGFIRRI